MRGEKYLIIVGGPTASGKTKMAIELAQHYQTEIISCDSRQFYQEMHIGTAKPSAEELNQAPHHFIGHLSITQDYNVGDFEQDALQLLEKLYQKYDQVILVGGSSLYIKALCEGLDTFPAVPASIRAQWNKVFEEEGIQALQKALLKHDPEYYEEVDLQNPNRLIRALSVFTSSGHPFSSFRTKTKVDRPFTPIYLKMEWDRALLYERINQRVDQMLEAGLLEEAKSLFPHRALNALQTVGYQELFDFIEGKTNLAEGLELIKRNTRRYAKRQLTWLRKEEQWKPVTPGALQEAINHVEECKKGN